MDKELATYEDLQTMIQCPNGQQYAVFHNGTNTVQFINDVDKDQ